MEVIEHEELEIKGWCGDDRQLAEKVVEAASCLANAHGGIVLVGIEEKTPRFSACPHANVSTAWLERRIKDNSIPPVECEVYDLSALLTQVRDTPRANAYGVVVPRTRYLCTHVTTKGISKIRVGKECRPYFVTADDDRTKAIVQDVSTADLSLTSITWAIAQHQKRFKTRSASDDPFEFLSTARMLEPFLPDTEQSIRYHVTLAALILFGKEAALSRVLPFFETVVRSNGQHQVIRKNVVESMRELLFSERSVLRPLFPRIPQSTIQELLINAYMHRCWRTAAPVIINLDPSHAEFQNPGNLLPGLHVSSLLHCVPAYRNLLLAEGSRFAGLCDKVGKGIGIVFESVLSGGFDFPVFESGDGRFTARISLSQSEEFSEFLRRRSSSLSSIDEILALRLLWAKSEATLVEIASVLQRGFDLARKVLREMERKNMVVCITDDAFRLAPGVHADIANIFHVDQMDLFGG